MVPRACMWVCLAFVLGGVTGCTAPLDETKTVTLDHGDKVRMTYDLNGQPKEQTITVTATSTDSEVDVFLVTADKQAEFDKASGEAQAKAAAGSALRTKDAKVTATVPAKTDARVVVQLVGLKKTEVKIRMTNKK